MRVPRFGLASLMACVAIIAANLGVIRTVFAVETPFTRFLVLGALPTGNILAVAALFARARPKNRGFLGDFVGFGIAAMTGLLAWGWFSPDSLAAIAMSAHRPIGEYLGFRPDGWQMGVLFLIASAILVVPQLVIALIGRVVLAFARRISRVEPVARDLS